MADDMKRFNHRWLVVVAVLYLALVWGLTFWDLWSLPFWQHGGRVLLALSACAVITATLFARSTRLNKTTRTWCDRQLSIFNSFFATMGRIVNRLREVALGLAILVALFIPIWYLLYSLDNAEKYYGVLLALTTSAIILGSLWINKWSERGTPSARHSSIALSFLIFSLSLLIYFLPNIEIIEELKDMSIQTKRELELNYSKLQFSPEQKQAIKHCRENRLATDYFYEDLIENKNMMKLIEEEHEKAVGEIDKRTEIDNDWFHNKFIMVGALFAAFIAYFTPLFNPSIRTEKQEKSNRWLELENHISDMFKTPVPLSILGMACTVSLAIDLHVRNNMMITQQLGLWIRDFVECLLTPGNAYIGWERFLRIKHDGIEGMHMLVLFDMLDAAHFYFTSIILYILYISCLVFYFHVCDCPLRKYSMYAIFLIFVLVHFTFLLFAIGGNTFPSTLKVEIIFWPGRHFSGDTGAVIPSMICLLISYLAAMRISTLYCASYDASTEIERRTHEIFERDRADNMKRARQEAISAPFKSQEAGRPGATHEGL